MAVWPASAPAAAPCFFGVLFRMLCPPSIYAIVCRRTRHSAFVLAPHDLLAVQKTLLLSYPDDFEESDASMAAECLEALQADTVVHCGELFGDCPMLDKAPWGRTSGAAFQQHLFSLFRSAPCRCVLAPLFPGPSPTEGRCGSATSSAVTHMHGVRHSFHQGCGQGRRDRAGRVCRGLLVQRRMQQVSVHAQQEAAPQHR